MSIYRYTYILLWRYVMMKLENYEYMQIIYIISIIQIVTNNKESGWKIKAKTKSNLYITLGVILQNNEIDISLDWKWKLWVALKT